jgi:hypothetical protein
MATNYTRCPVCGHLARDEQLVRAESEVGHELQRATCEIGGRGACAWSFEDLALEEQLRLADMLGRLSQRIATRAGGISHWIRLPRPLKCDLCGTWLANQAALKRHTRNCKKTK